MPSPLLPPFQDLSVSPESLLSFLSLLLEPTPILKSLLVPQLEEIFSHPAAAPTDYGDVLRKAEGVVDVWSREDKTSFVEGHPRIGEGDVLSELSKKEQGVGGPPTTQETLDRLKHLNSLYEVTYPRLRYITFVAGRPRAAIAVEMEQLLGDSPVVKEIGSAEWESELERAVKDVWRIGHARLGGLEKEM